MALVVGGREVLPVSGPGHSTARGGRPAEALDRETASFPPCALHPANPVANGDIRRGGQGRGDLEQEHAELRGVEVLHLPRTRPAASRSRARRGLPGNRGGAGTSTSPPRVSTHGQPHDSGEGPASQGRAASPPTGPNTVGAAHRETLHAATSPSSTTKRPQQCASTDTQQRAYSPQHTSTPPAAPRAGPPGGAPTPRPPSAAPASAPPRRRRRSRMRRRRTPRRPRAARA